MAEQPKPKTHRSRSHLVFVRSRPCAWCGRRERVEASHHGQRGMALKASDYNCIPLCGGPESCHDHHTRKHGLPDSKMSPEQTETWFAHQALIVCGDRIAELEAA